MRLLSLEVRNYRNIETAQLQPGRELTVICGNNGQGKTNLLEAIWLLTGGKSFRGGKDAELVRRGETFAVLEAVTQRTRQEDQEPDDPARVRMTVGTPDAPRPGRYASVNGAAPKRAASLAGSFPAVVFDPGHLSLVKGAPEGRRRFLDAALCQLYPGYLATYRRYVRTLQQKNALLRHSAAGKERPYAEKCALLEVLNVELAALGEKTAEGLLDGTDDTASIYLRTRVCKVRHMTKTISQDLKAAYGYRCQICGQYIGEPYGSNLIHAHHIDYFVKSLNNNASNIMILCPNHHGIIHDRNPIFDFSSKTFRYPNGYVEGLRLNLHLK